MRIGIISDTHNNRTTLTKALQVLSSQHIELLVHCGDMTDVETANLLLEHRLIYVYGNLDVASGEIRRTLTSNDPGNYVGPLFTGEVAGIPMAVIHGDRPGTVDGLAGSGKYRYVLHGHTHLHRDKQIGETRVINPGALGGVRREPRSACILDLSSGELTFLEID